MYNLQNLRQNHAPKLGGDLSAGHKIDIFFQVTKYAISNVLIINNQYLQLFIVSVSRKLRQNWALGSRPTAYVNDKQTSRRLSGEMHHCPRSSVSQSELSACICPARWQTSALLWTSDHRRPSALPLPRLPPRFLLLYSGPVEMAC